MLLYSNLIRKNLFRFLKLCLLFILFQSCKTYQDPVSFKQAVDNKEVTLIKIKMINGDEFLYEDLEIIEGLYYGIRTRDGEKVKIELDKDSIKEVQLRNKNSSKGSNVLGISIGVLALISGLLMIQ